MVQIFQSQLRRHESVLLEEEVCAVPEEKLFELLHLIYFSCHFSFIYSSAFV